MEMARPLLKFTLSGAPAVTRAPASPVSEKVASTLSGPGSLAAAAPRLEPTLVEVLASELALATLEGESSSEALGKAVQSEGLFAVLRCEAKGGGFSWLAVFDTASSEPPEACDPRPVAALRLRPRADASAAPCEALALLCQLLEDSGLKPWPLASGDEVMILVDVARAQSAAHTLISAGHAVGPPARITPPPPDLGDGLNAASAEQFCGVWRLTSRQHPPSAVVEKYGRGDGPIRIVAPSGVYVEVSIRNPGEVAGQGSSCGLLSVEGAGDQPILVRHATLSFEPPIGGARSSRVALDSGGGDEGEDVAVETLIDDVRGNEVDRWERIGTGEVTVLELASAEPPAIGSEARAGFWLFCSGYWARITGLPHGSGLLAGRCCRSLEQAQDIYGENAVEKELRTHFHASCGSIDKPGLLSTTREAWIAVQESVLYDANKNRDEVRKDGDVIVHTPGSGETTTWDVRAFAMDPFTPVAKRTSKPTAPQGLRKRGGDSESEEASGSAASSDSSEKKKKKESDASDSGSDSSKSSQQAKKKDKEKEKEKDKEKEKEKKSKSDSSSSSSSSGKKKKEEKDRSRSRDRKKSRSRDRGRDKKDREKDRSRDRDRERRDKERDRSRRDRSRDRRDKDRSRDRDRDRRDRSRDRDRDRRDRSKDKRSRSRDRDRRDRDRSRDRDRDRSKKDRDRSRDRDRDRDQKKSSRDRERDRREKERDRSRERDKKKDKDRSRSRDEKKAASSSDDSDDSDAAKEKKSEKAANKKGAKKEKHSDKDSDDSSDEKKGSTKKKGKEKKEKSKKDKKAKDSDSSESKAGKKSDSSDSDAEDAKKAKRKSRSKKSEADSSDSD